MTVVHSWYWRSPHWSYEAAYIFELEITDPNLLNGFKQALEPYTGQELDYPIDNFFATKPIWFIPSSLKEYDIWIEGTDMFSHYKLFIHRSTGRVYITDFQV